MKVQNFDVNNKIPSIINFGRIKLQHPYIKLIYMYLHVHVDMSFKFNFQRFDGSFENFTIENFLLYTELDFVVIVSDQNLQ